LTKEWGDQNGVKVRVDHIPHLELPARMAAEYAAGAGHDIIMNGSSILTRLYYKSLADLTDVYDAAGKKHGGWIPTAKALVEAEGRYYGIPLFYILLPMTYRKDLFDANGLKAPDTWELARVAARTLKPKGHPTGIQFSQCADANLNWRSILFSFGGAELDPSGENILIDSKETREALRFAKALFDEGMTAEVFSWDDASDNRYLASGIACWVHDAISAYRTTEDTNPDVFKNTFIGMEPAGPNGKRVNTCAANVWMVWKFSKNQQAAKEFLTHMVDTFSEGMTASRGYNMPYLNGLAKKPMPVIGSDPKLQILQDFPPIVAFYGYPGPFITPIQEVVNLFVLLLVGAPFLFSLYLAVSDANVGDPVATFIGLENFRSALEMDVFWTALRNSVVFLVVAAVFKSILGTSLAFLLLQEFPGKKLIRGLVVIPF